MIPILIFLSATWISSIHSSTRQLQELANEHMELFNDIVLSINLTKFRENFKTPYTIHWCDDEFRLKTTQVDVIRDDFDYPIGSDASFGLGLVAFAAKWVVDDKILEYRTQGFNMQNIHRLEKIGEKFIFSEETRHVCHENLY
ncbi:unnamed protein product [Caenorhabditis angaria]|uniref:Glycosyltransferase family 92 protein n=1 Tax=Caenorhabditis angaria TaxID=860376 RepID=A0A9P1IMM6_9PELO|nr:unnamed protein product [Caenorhabditis angaria]